MINLIVGNKGSGKTKKMIDMLNGVQETTKGNIVCIEKGMKLTYDIKHTVRLIAADDYKVCCFECFFGFIGGLLASDYDISEIFVDGILRMIGRDLSAFEGLLTKLEPILNNSGCNITFTVSADEKDLPEGLKQYLRA